MSATDESGLNGGVISVVLVDDLAEVRQLVRTALRVRGGFDIVGEAGDGAAAVALAASLHPDVVVLDLGLPDLAGREVLTGIRERSPFTRIVVFTGTPNQHEGDTQRADAFVEKDAELNYLVDLLQAIGKRHGRRAELYLVNERASVSLARRFARSVLQAWRIDYGVDEVLLVVSELVTNALEHAQSPCRLRLELTMSGLRVGVQDEGRGTPDLRTANTGSEHGRGLYLVATFAAAWGTERTADGGKVVWAELPRSPASPPAGGPSVAGGADGPNRLILC
jgi:CheY-like chemotaxis protein